MPNGINTHWLVEANLRCPVIMHVIGPNKGFFHPSISLHLYTHSLTHSLAYSSLIHLNIKLIQQEQQNK